MSVDVDSCDAQSVFSPFLIQKGQYSYFYCGQSGGREKKREVRGG
jgi:hypothetical protein